MKHKVKCAVCGRTGFVEIDDETREIKSEWGYWGKIKLADGKLVEYWECPKCIRR
jgi:predicted nucleic-acid-binding Zn-ribbon protein